MEPIDYGKNPCPKPMDPTGPHRETATTRLQYIRDRTAEHLAHVDALLAVAKRAEVGSPLEIALYKATLGLTVPS